MSKIFLGDVTLVCGDADPERKSMISRLFSGLEKEIQFADMIHYDKDINSIEEYNLFCSKKLNELVDTDYCMVVQWDGYPINFSSWKSEFLDYDYIGAPWLLQPWTKDKTVGNGGFSIRSKRYLEQCASADYDGSIPEDVFFCRVQKLDCSYAPIGVAYDFSVEDMPYKNQFGFHGKATLEINKQMGIFA